MGVGCGKEGRERELCLVCKMNNNNKTQNLSCAKSCVKIATVLWKQGFQIPVRCTDTLVSQTVLLVVKRHHEL